MRRCVFSAGWGGPPGPRPTPSSAFFCLMRRTALGLFVAGTLFAQPTPFERLKREAASAKTLPADKENHDAVTALHSALRDWIESRLPQTPGPAELRNLETDLQSELENNGLTTADTGPDSPGLGYVGVELNGCRNCPTRWRSSRVSKSNVARTKQFICIDSIGVGEHACSRTVRKARGDIPASSLLFPIRILRAGAYC